LKPLSPADVEGRFAPDCLPIPGMAPHPLSTSAMADSMAIAQFFGLPFQLFAPFTTLSGYGAAEQATAQAAGECAGYVMAGIVMAGLLPEQGKFQPDFYG